MNPLFSCCAYYCTGVAIVGIFFYGVILIMLATESRYLEPEDPSEGFGDRITAVAIAMGVSIPNPI